MTAAPHPKLDELIALLEKLRAPGGCVWDGEQTHESLVKYLVEETHELIEAIETGDRDGILEELGDVLYQIVFHADIAANTPGEGFTLEDVAARMSAKMISRHPHVFGDDDVKAALGITSGDDVAAAWDELKKADKPDRTSVLEGIPVGMPSLALADKLLGKAQKLGLFDSDAAPVIAVDSEEDLGRLLLGIVASANSSGLDAERALRGTLRELQGEIREHEANNLP